MYKCICISIGIEVYIEYMCLCMMYVYVYISMYVYIYIYTCICGHPPPDRYLMASYNTTYSAQRTCAGNAVNTDKLCTVQMRFRFCLSDLSESVFCIFLNQM